MASVAQLNFGVRLDSVDRIIEAQTHLSRRFRTDIVNSGVVFLAAATEAFLEEIYKEAAELIFSGMTEKEFKAFFEATVKKFHNASLIKTELLYFNLGLAWALQGISWPGFSNQHFRESWESFFTTRNRLVHGALIAVPLSDLRRWRNMVERFVPLFENRLEGHVLATTNRPSGW
jgi:hypothetical protein